MTTTVQAYEPLGHGEAMVLAAAEYSRLITLLESLTEDEWQRPTECTPWTVRDMATHLLGYMRFSCSVREQARQLRAAKRRGGSIADSVAALQVEELRDLSPAQILTEIRERAEPAVRGRRRVPAVVRRGVRVAAELPVSGRQERWPMGYLVDIIGTRDGWMHRLDLCRALGREPVLTPEHDGRLVADVAGEWARRHGQPVDLHLTGPAGGHFGTGSGKTALSYDAITFCRLPPDATASPSSAQRFLSKDHPRADPRSAEDKPSDHLADQAVTLQSRRPRTPRLPADRASPGLLADRGPAGLPGGPAPLGCSAVLEHRWSPRSSSRPASRQQPVPASATTTARAGHGRRTDRTRGLRNARWPSRRCPIWRTGNAGGRCVAGSSYVRSSRTACRWQPPPGTAGCSTSAGCSVRSIETSPSRVDEVV